MSSLVLPEYEELDDKHIKRWERTKFQMESPWLGSENYKWETKVKVPSTSITAFVQYTTEELDQLDRLHGQRLRGRENLQASAIPPMVYGITQQESLADIDNETKRQGTPVMDQTIMKRKSKGERVSPTEEVSTGPLTQFTQNILGSSVITVRPKIISTQTKTTSNQEPICPDFYLPDGRGSRLSEVHQIKTGEKSPEGNPTVLIVLENLRTKYGTKFFLLDQYSGHLYVAGNETIGPDPIEEKGWIYPTGSSLPVVGALNEFQQTPYRSMQVSNIKETPDAESTQVPYINCKEINRETYVR